MSLKVLGRLISYALWHVTYYDNKMKENNSKSCISFLPRLGCKNPEVGSLLKTLFQTAYFRIVVVEDETTVEICGALKVSLLLGAKTGFYIN